MKVKDFFFKFKKSQKPAVSRNSRSSIQS